MADSKEAWEQVGEQFAALGRRLRDTPEALQGLAGAVDRIVDSVAEAVRDPEFQDDVRSAARSLGEALTATVDEARRRIGGPRPGE
ncbi:MAG TPA: hypothetical protein VM938_04520 [Acidimicrobiales bacterium]|nr:hypothetical protein [Acidimicrobiales bacterium]